MDREGRSTPQLAGGGQPAVLVEPLFDVSVAGFPGPAPENALWPMHDGRR